MILRDDMNPVDGNKTETTTTTKKIKIIQRLMNQKYHYGCQVILPVSFLHQPKIGS